MFTSTPATCSNCSKVTTAKFALASGGLCPTCLKEADATPRVCASCGNPFLWHVRFATVVGHPAEPQQVCPTCADQTQRANDPDQPVVVRRRPLVDLPVVQIDLDLEAAEICDPAGKAAQGRSPARRMVIKDKHGCSFTGRCDVFDYRQDECRGYGSLARLRVMEVTHDRPRTLTVRTGTPLGPKHEQTLEFDPTYQYIVLEPVVSRIGLPVARLIAARYHRKSALKGGMPASGGVARDSSIWSVHLTSSSRTGAHGGGTLLAVVDNTHPVIVRQDHLVLKFDLDGEAPDEEGFRAPDGNVTPSVFVPGADIDLVERVRAQDFPAKTAGEATFIALKKSESGWQLPDGLPERFLLRLEAAEAGGGTTSTGYAVIVCGHRGERLRPFATSGHRGHQACGTHAWFSRTGGLVTINADYRAKSDPTTTVTITRHTVRADGFLATVRSEQEWSGDPAHLPQRLSMFRDALNAACRKAADYHCRTIHFAS